MEKIVSLCKRRGFIYQGSEIYGGLAGTWDWGPHGVEFKKNIQNLWWKMFVYDHTDHDGHKDMYGLDAAILMNPKVWEASGHVTGFVDPLDDGSRFNTMFRTSVGAGKDALTSYLRPETAQGIFVNYKNVFDSIHPWLPFGIAQIGKAFRNEIAPRDFIFRSREFEQMEVEYFVKENEWEKYFEKWKEQMYLYMGTVGIAQEKIHELEVPDPERAHYSKRTVDFEFDFPFGRKELCGLAYRADFDLSAHAKVSGQSLKYAGEVGKEPFFPHVIEPSLGVERIALAVLISAYTEDQLGDETRAYLKLKPAVAPVKAAVFPLLKNKPELVSKARDVFDALKKDVPQVMFDDNGNIGKRYRRQDEIGTPFCITIDFDTLTDGTVTLRDRDSGTQERLSVTDAITAVKKASVLG